MAMFTSVAVSSVTATPMKIAASYTTVVGAPVCECVHDNKKKEGENEGMVSKAN